MYNRKDELESAVKSLERITGLVTGMPVCQSLTSGDLLRPLTGPGRLIPSLTGGLTGGLSGLSGGLLSLPSSAGLGTLTNGTNLPTNGVRLPKNGVKLPANGTKLPSTGVKLPSTGAKLPSTGSKLPSTGAKLPSTGVKLPSTGVKVPPTGVKLPPTALLNKLQSQNASLLSSNSLLKKETAKIKKGLSEAQKGLTEAKKGFQGVSQDLSSTKRQLSDKEKELLDKEKELLRIKEENEELTKALENKPGSSRPKATKNPLIGSFNTKSVRPESVAVEKTSKKVSFAKAYPAPPSIAVGLYSIDIPNGNSTRVSCFTSNLDGKSFEININGDPTTKVNSGGCIWLEIEPEHQDFQYGRFNTLEDHPWRTSKTQHSRRISFARPYTEPPKIIVWLCAFDMNPQKSWRVKAYASDINATAFTMNIDTWGDTELYSAVASWIAYPASKKDVHSASFSTLDVRPNTNPQTNTSGPTKFPEGMFKSMPRIILGINALDISCKKDLKLEVSGTAASARGMTWQLNTWKDTTLYSAGGTYIALT